MWLLLAQLAAAEPMLVASRDLYPGIPIEAGDLLLIETDPGYADHDHFDTAEAVVGRTPTRRILANEVIRPERVEPADIALVRHAASRLMNPADGVPTVFATQQVSRGEAIGAGVLMTRKLPADLRPADVAFEQPEDVVGRVVIDTLLPGDLVRVERLGHPQAGIGLNALIPRNYRAVSIGPTSGANMDSYVHLERGDCTLVANARVIGVWTGDTVHYEPVSRLPTRLEVALKATDVAGVLAALTTSDLTVGLGDPLGVAAPPQPMCGEAE